MLGQIATKSPGTDNRIFIYEVAGLQQNEVTESYSTPIRTSNNQFIQVPFSRMNDFMQRITMMQGKIVNIFPLGSQSSTAEHSDSGDDSVSDSVSDSAEPERSDDSA